MPIIRNRDWSAGNFTRVDNATLNGGRLSWAAQGLHAFMLSKPDDWRFTVDWLATQAKGGREKTSTALKELEAAGYVMRMRTRGAPGKPPRLEWIVYEVSQFPPTTGKPGPGNPVTGNPVTGNPDSYQDCRYQDCLYQDCSDQCLASRRGATSEKRAGSAAREPGNQDQDFNLFVDLLGGTTVELTHPWTPAGTHSAQALYDALHKNGPSQGAPPWKLPGRYLQKIADDSGLENWLVANGIEPITDPWQAA